MFWLLPAVLLAGCATCDFSGYDAMTVALVEGDAATQTVLTEDGRGNPGCAIYTDIPVDVKEPDAYGEQLRHIGEGVYSCLTRSAPLAVDTSLAFYRERLYFRVDGKCPASTKEGYTYYGCFNFACRTIDTNLSHIGPPAVCPSGTPMSKWSDACWTQFYEVLGHEVSHGWLGEFHQ